MSEAVIDNPFSLVLSYLFHTLSSQPPPPPTMFALPIPTSAPLL